MNQPAHRPPIEILLVEDQPGDVRLTQEALRESRLGTRLHVAYDGEQALAMLRQQEPYHSLPCPDLILLDLNLPKRDGRQVLEEIKRDPQLKPIPLIVFTTSRAPDDVRRSYELNANCYVTKPGDFEQFMALVRSIEQFWLNVATLPSRHSTTQTPT